MGGPLAFGIQHSASGIDSFSLKSRCSLSSLNKMLLRAFGVFLLAAAAAGHAAAPPPSDWIAYVGTYTRAPSKGIYAYRSRSATGELTPVGAASARAFLI